MMRNLPDDNILVIRTALVPPSNYQADDVDILLKSTNLWAFGCDVTFEQGYLYYNYKVIDFDLGVATSKLLMLR